MQTCPFCKQEENHEKMTKVSGFEICNLCFYGDLPDRLKQYRNWGHTINQWTVDHDDHITHHMEIIVFLRRDIPLIFKAYQRTWWRKLLGFLFRGIQVGDPLFDNFVYLKTPTPQLAQEWLSDERAQSSLMDLLGDFSVIKVSKNRIYGKHSSGDYTDSQALFVEVAALAQTLDIFIDEL